MPRPNVQLYRLSIYLCNSCIIGLSENWVRVYPKLLCQVCLSMIKSPQVLGGQTPSNLSTNEPLGTPDALGSVARWRGAFPVGPEDQWVYDLVGVLQVLQVLEGWICLTCRMSYLVQVLMISALLYSSLSCYQLLFLLYVYLLQFFWVSTFIHRVPILFVVFEGSCSVLVGPHSIYWTCSSLFPGQQCSCLRNGG